LETSGNFPAFRASLETQAKTGWKYSMKQKGLFDEEERLRKLSAAGDPLAKITANIKKKGELPENWKADENDHSKEAE
jgi:hypothetical protein